VRKKQQQQQQLEIGKVQNTQQHPLVQSSPNPNQHNQQHKPPVTMGTNDTIGNNKTIL